MRVKIGDKTFDTKDHIISVYLDDGELEVVKGKEKGGVYTHYPFDAKSTPEQEAITNAAIAQHQDLMKEMGCDS